MQRLIIVRHGYPEHMDDDRTGGWTNSHLTELGKCQARVTGKRIAEMLSEHKKDLVFYSSDLSRTRETAESISEQLGVSPLLSPELREQSLGDANSLSTIEAEHYAMHPSDETPPVDRVFFRNAETWREMMHRIFTFLDKIAEDNPETALLVSHAGASICIVFWWLGIAPDRWPDVQFEFDLCSITELTVGDFDGRRIYRHNDVRHLGNLHA